MPNPFHTLSVRVPTFICVFYRTGSSLLFGPINAVESLSSFFPPHIAGRPRSLRCKKNYLAAQIAQLFMLHSTSDTPLELLTSEPILITALLWLPYKLHLPSLSPLKLHSLKTWDSVCYLDNLMSSFLPILLILNNPLFPLDMEQPDVYMVVVSWVPTYSIFYLLGSHCKKLMRFPPWSFLLLNTTLTLDNDSTQNFFFSLSNTSFAHMSTLSWVTWTYLCNLCYIKQS